MEGSLGPPISEGVGKVGMGMAVKALARFMLGRRELGMSCDSAEKELWMGKGVSDRENSLCKGPEEH